MQAPKLLQFKISAELLRGSPVPGEFIKLHAVCCVLGLLRSSSKIMASLLCIITIEGIRGAVSVVFVVLSSPEEAAADSSNPTPWKWCWPSGTALLRFEVCRCEILLSCCFLFPSCVCFSFLPCSSWGMPADGRDVCLSLCRDLGAALLPAALAAVVWASACSHQAQEASDTLSLASLACFQGQR